MSATLALAAAFCSPLSALPALLLLPTAVATTWRWGVWQGALGRWMAVWLLWLPCSVLLSHAPGVAQPHWAVLSGLPLAWLAGYRLAALGRLDCWLLRVLPVLLLVLVVWGVWQGPDTLTGKPQGPFNDPNLYAACLNLLMLPLLAHWLTLRAEATGWLRLAGLALLSGGLFVFFLVASRGAGLSLFLLLPLLFWASRRQPDAWKNGALFLLAALLSALAAYWVNEGANIAARFIQTLHEGDSARGLLLRAAWAMALEQPWFGIGLGGFRSMYPRYRHWAENDTPGFWVHNDYLQLWLEAGLPMLLLLLVLVVWVGRWIGQCLADVQPASIRRLGYLLAIASALLQANTNFIFYFSPLLLLLGFYLVRVMPPSQLVAVPASMPMRALSAGYGVALAYLLVVLVAVEVLLTHGLAVQNHLLAWRLPYPRLAIAQVLARVDPYLPAPHEAMAIEAAADMLDADSHPIELRQRFIGHLDDALGLAPCTTHYTLEILEQLRLQPRTQARRDFAQQLIARDLECNPRHGMAYFYAGWFQAASGSVGGMDATRWWRAGLAATTTAGERVLLAAALLAEVSPEHADELRKQVEVLAFSLKQRDGFPAAMNAPEVWRAAHETLLRCCGAHYLDLAMQD